MKTFKLETPIEVYNNEGGKYDLQDTIEVKFPGLQGNRALRKLQDTIFKSFNQMRSSMNSGKTETKEDKKDKNISAAELADMLEMTGSSEKLFTEVMKTLEKFASIGGNLLVEEIQNQIDHEDLDELHAMVIRDFLSPKVIKMMNNTKI